MTLAGASTSLTSRINGMTAHNLRWRRFVSKQTKSLKKFEEETMASQNSCQKLGIRCAPFGLAPINPNPPSRYDVTDFPPVTGGMAKFVCPSIAVGLL